MTVIVLDMQSVLYARLLERAMLQELDNHQIIISKTPNLTKDICVLQQNIRNRLSREILITMKKR